MSEDWFDVVFINGEKAILHGNRADQTQVEIVLTEIQVGAIEALDHKHRREMQRLLRGFAQ